MRKISLVVIALMLFILVSCVDKTYQDLIIEIKEELFIDDDYYIEIENPNNLKIEIKSTKENIVYVDSSYRVLALNEGVAEIDVYVDGKSYLSKTVIVMQRPELESIEFVIEHQNIYYAGQDYKVDVLFLPYGALPKEVRYSFSNGSINLDEKTMTINFSKAGLVKLNAYLIDDYEVKSSIELDIKYSEDTKIYDLLFIGNSLTKYTFNIPYFVYEMMNEAGYIVYFEVENGQQYLYQHKQTLTYLLEKDRFTHVILQEKSDGLVTNFKQFEDSVYEFDEMIKSNGAKTVLYQTWTYNYQTMDEKTDMHEIVSNGYLEVGNEIGAKVTQAGDVFMEVIENYPDINLYADFNHPNINGAYLSALVHFVTLTNQKATSVKFLPNYIDAETAEILKIIVDKFFLTN